MNIKLTKNLNKNKEERLNNEENNKNNIPNPSFFENSISISGIENKEIEQTKNYEANEMYNDNITLNSNLEDQSIHQLNKEINSNKIKKKLTKEDLDNIPLPIFSCIYCSNDFLSFKHLLDQNLSSKYYLQTTIYDKKELDKLIKNQPLIDRDIKNSSLVHIIIRNTDYLRKYYPKENSIAYFKSNKYKNICNSNNLKIKHFLYQKLEIFIIRKKSTDLTNKKINNNKFMNKNISYNKISFHNNNSSSIVNDNFYNALGNIKNNNNTYGTGTCQGTGSYSSMNNLISFSLNNNENNNNNILCFNNLNMMENIMEKIEKNEESENDEEGGQEFLNIFGNESQIQKKINKNKIIFDDKFYDIWNPVITIINESQTEDERLALNNNEIGDKNNLNIIENNKDKFQKEKKGTTNSQKIFSDKRINEIKKLFNYSQTSLLKNKLNDNVIKNENKKLFKINIKKNDTSNEANINHDNNINNLNKKNFENNKSNEHFKNNLFKFKSFYMNKNRKNLNNLNNNLLNIFLNKNSANLDILESLCHTKNIDKNNNKENNNYDKNKKENKKLSNMTINTSNQDSKNLLFLLKYPRTTSHSNKINDNKRNIEANSPLMTKKPFSSYNNRDNENFILIKSKINTRNSTSRLRKSMNKPKLVSEFYDNMLIHNSRNYLNKRKKILNSNYQVNENLIKSSNSLFNGNLNDRNSFSSSTNFQINISKIGNKKQTNENLKELMKKIFQKNNNYKINGHDFKFPYKKLKEIKYKQKMNINIHAPLISKRSISVSPPLLQKKNLIKLKL